MNRFDIMGVVRLSIVPWGELAAMYTSAHLADKVEQNKAGYPQPPGSGLTGGMAALHTGAEHDKTRPHPRFP